MGGLVRGLILVSLVVGSGCLQADVTRCSDGSVCPSGTTCDVANQRCLTSEQTEACAAVPELGPCELSGIPQGICVDGVCEPAGCGDGVLGPLEQCEPGLAVEVTCSDRGFYVTNGPVGCHDDCTFDTGNCAETCGDEVRNGPEDCEIADLPELDCTDFGFYLPDGLGCTTYCRFDVSACSQTCGDHVLNGPEVCEDDPPAGKTCLDYGFDTGLLACSGSCTPGFDDCAVVGWRERPVGVPTLADVWGASPDDIWAVGTDGAIVHFDGGQWSDLTAEVGETGHLFSIWGASATDVWAVGAAGRILHWNGTAWTGTTVGTADLRAVWGTAAGDVWAVGAAGTILRWNGAAWSPQTSPTGGTLAAVWGYPDDIWVGGTEIAARWNGTAWTTLLASSPGVVEIWGTAPDSVYVVGSGLGTFHWDGAGLRQLPVSLAASAIGGSRATHVAIGGNAFLLHDDGTELAMADLPIPRAVNGIWGFPDGTIVAVGAQGVALHWEAQVGWTRQEWTGDPLVRDVWMASPYHGFAIDQYNVYELIGGGDWVGVVTLGGPLQAIGGSASDDVWVAGSSGIWHNDGSPAWVQTSTTSIWGVWARTRDDAFAVGPLGTILHWDGASWSPMTSGTTEPLLAVWGSGPGDVFAAGWNGTILHHDGTSWTAMASGTTEALRGLGGTGPDDVWAVSQTGGVFHWDGTAWTANSPGVDESFYRVLALAPDDVLIGGSGGRLHRWNGTVWMPIRQPLAFEVIGMSGGPQAITLAMGGGGDRILRMIRTASCAAAETRCGDGFDDDCDGAMDCDDGECAADAGCAGAGACGPSTALTCGGGPVSGTTIGAGNDITDYGCGDLPLTGPDRGYTFTSATDRTVTVTVSPSGQNVLDLILVGSTATGACGPADHCLSVVHPATGNAQVTFRAYAGETYHLVVDGYQGDAASYSVQVSCGP